MGIKVTMLTGDAAATAQAVARQVGIDEDEVYSGVSPKGKAKIVQDLDEASGGVAMVGDGINDSPALVAASLGIALSSGTSIAIEAADVVLVRSDLLDVVAALDLGQVIFRKIKANLIWACCYNVLMIPLAMGVLLPWGIHLHPMMAAAAMAFSSVSVVVSSLTLKVSISNCYTLMALTAFFPLLFLFGSGGLGPSRQSLLEKPIFPQSSQECCVCLRRRRQRHHHGWC